MLEDFAGCRGFHILQLWLCRRAGIKPAKPSKASTFDNGDSKRKLENPLLYKDLTDSIQVIS
ncbi:hypothetical protein [Polaromonas sp.]|uniref:hypothetical protein n=1 Tax=Polaromonas sp. TaxID=1869339 RepID=UPI0024883136|nr:hypothetical protein [Polaromonas sp.]MDI1338388.1 hypothetical protein [Polaromonas sp.]